MSVTVSMSSTVYNNCECSGLILKYSFRGEKKCKIPILVTFLFTRQIFEYLTNVFDLSRFSF